MNCGDVPVISKSTRKNRPIGSVVSGPKIAFPAVVVIAAAAVASVSHVEPSSECISFAVNEGEVPDATPTVTLTRGAWSPGSLSYTVDDVLAVTVCDSNNVLISGINSF